MTAVVRVVLICAAAIFLASCEDRETARTRNEQQLPPGCKIVDLDYGDLTAAVVCDGRKSTTSLREWDETTYLTTVGANGAITSSPIITHHANISATIEP